jgi:hypothetical protein
MLGFIFLFLVIERRRKKKDQEKWKERKKRAFASSSSSLDVFLVLLFPGWSVFGQGSFFNYRVALSSSSLSFFYMILLLFVFYPQLLLMGIIHFFFRCSLAFFFSIRRISFSFSDINNFRANSPAYEYPRWMDRQRKKRKCRN